MRKFILSFIACLVFAVLADAQQQQEVIHLKDGRVLHGTVTELVPGESIKVQLKDGSILSFKLSEVDRITMQTIRPSSPRSSTPLRFGSNIELGYTIGSKKGNRAEVFTSFGVKLSPKLYVGAGVGADYYTSAEGWFVPIFLNARGRLPMKSGITPFLDVKTGYSFSIRMGGANGPFSTLLVGLEVKALSIGVGLASQTLLTSISTQFASVNIPGTTTGPTLRVGVAF